MSIKLIIFSGFQSILFGLVAYLIAKYVENHKPKNKFLKKTWKKEKKLRRWIMKYIWLIGIIYFITLLFYAYLISYSR